MSRISHFQVYSGRENHVTNNTMLMMRHVYRISPMLVSKLLTSLLDNEISIGLNFAQQERGLSSVPDAAITQAPIFVYFEAKHGAGKLYDDQMRRHIKSIAEKKHPAGSAYLIGLTRDEPSAPDRESFVALGKQDDIQSASKTYSDFVEVLRELCSEHPLLSEIFIDYESFLANEGVLVNRDHWLVAFPCGTSWKENAKFGVYYEPAQRNAKLESAFIGLFHDKKISHIGRIQAVAVCVFDGTKLSVEVEEHGTLDQSQRDRIVAVIRSATYYEGFAKNPHRMYVVDHFNDADLRKISAGGMVGLRYFNIRKLAPELNGSKTLTTALVASNLRGKTFD